MAEYLRTAIIVFKMMKHSNNLCCGLDTKSVKTLKGNNCEKKREHSHSEIAKANRPELASIAISPCSSPPDVPRD